MTNAARPPTPSDPIRRHEEFGDDQADSQRHEGETREVDRQQLQSVKPQQQRQRTDHTRQDRSGVIALEQQPVDADQ